LTPQERTWPPGNEKRRAGDILMGTLVLSLTRSRMEIFSGPKSTPGWSNRGSKVNMVKNR
jgi:hypothetical protein